MVKFKLIKDIIIGLAIPIAALTFWIVSPPNPMNDFRLITNSKIANGQITEAKVAEELVEANDGRTGKLAYYYGYKYDFVLPSEESITSWGKEDGDIPEHLANLQYPYPVQIEYLEENPKISRVKGMKSNDTTIPQWIRHKVAIPFVIFLLLCYWGYTIIRNSLNEHQIKKPN
jgi:hypothetical protein